MAEHPTWSSTLARPLHRQPHPFLHIYRAVIASEASTRCPFLNAESAKNWIHFSLLIWICGLAFEGRSVLLISKLLGRVRCRNVFQCVLGRIIVVALIIVATGYSCCVFGGLYFNYVYQVRATELSEGDTGYMCLLSTECCTHQYGTGSACDSFL